MPRGDNAGRKTHLTPERHAGIVRDLRTGLYASQVAIKNGISRFTLRNWIIRGLAEDAIEPYLSFARDYMLADIEVEQAALLKIQEAGDPYTEEWIKNKKKIRVTRPKEISGTDSDDEVSNEKVVRRGDWRAVAWFMEKRWPKRYGSIAKDQITTDDVPLPQLQEEASSRPKDLKELLLEPPTELEDILLDPEVRESLLRRLGGG